MTPSTGRGLRFAFGSCTSGRTTDYNSFATAASLDPEFYLHGGDFGYANLNSVEHSPDHFQARWSRLVRVPEMTQLLDKAPLMFWQDDHDYQSDNGWSKTCKPYTIWSFDEFHANPTDHYFDVRWGDVHVWCLDCRLYATDPEAPDDANKSRIGFEQKAWLKKGMRESDAPVRVVASAMVFRNKVNDDPGWHNVYTTERDELLGFFASIRDEQDATVFILSGDSHGHRLIHHYEFGELFEITASGTDFPPEAHWWQGNNDPQHTIYSIDARTGFALIELDPPGPNRTITIKSTASKDGAVMFLKVLPVST
jgi:phosphodiesterase/alkaline phosphatase D-like protein